MNIYIDFAKGKIEKVTPAPIYFGDNNVDKITLYFKNVADGVEWYPTLSALCSDNNPIYPRLFDTDGTGTKTIDGVDYTYYEFTLSNSNGWNLTPGRTLFYVWVNYPNTNGNKCVGTFGCTILGTSGYYKVDNLVVNPELREYLETSFQQHYNEVDEKFEELSNDINTSFNELEEEFNDEYTEEVNAQRDLINNLIGGEPRYVNTSSNILALTSNKGVAVGTDTGHWYYWDGTQYVDGGVYQGTEITDGQITYDNLNENAKPYDVVASANIYNYETKTDGYYYAYNTGRKETNQYFCYSEYINVYGKTNVTISRWHKYSIDGVHICFFNQNKEYISGGLPTPSNPTLTIPNGAYYMIFSCSIGWSQSFKIEFGSTITHYSPYIVEKGYGNERVDVYMDATLLASDYNWFRYYLQAAGEMASEKRWINLHIPKGRYDTYAMFESSEKTASGFVGMFVPDYVFLIGESPEETILTTSLETQSTQISTLNFANTCGIENLTVTGTNTRYAIHDDFADPAQYNKYYYRIVKNCIFDGTNTAYGFYGSGSKSGAIWLFENIKTPGISWHSNVNFTIPNDITFKNIQIIPRGINPLVLKSLDSGVTNKIHIIGCDIPIVRCWEETTDIGYDFEIDGYGNNDFAIDWVNANHPIQLLSDKISLLVANTTYSKGIPVYKVAQIFGKAVNGYRATGVLLEDCVNGDVVHILTSGYYQLRDLGLDTTIPNGTLMRVNTNGEIVTATTDNYYGNVIGIVEDQYGCKCLKLFKR